MPQIRSSFFLETSRLKTQFFSDLLLYIHIHTHTYTHIHIHTHTHTYTHTHTHTHTTYTYIHTHTYTYTYTHTHTYTYSTKSRKLGFRPLGPLDRKLAGFWRFANYQKWKLGYLSGTTGGAGGAAAEKPGYLVGEPLFLLRSGCRTWLTPLKKLAGESGTPEWPEMEMDYSRTAGEKLGPAAPAGNVFPYSRFHHGPARSFFL